MFGAMGRLFRTIGALLTGKIDRAADEIATNPDAMKAEYAEIIRAKKESLNTAMDAVSELKALELKVKNEADRLMTEIEKLEKMRTGAAAMAKKRVAALKAQGQGGDVIKADAEVMKCQSAFNDFNSTLESKSAELKRKEDMSTQYGEGLKKHMVQLDKLQRDIAHIEAESHEAVADVISSKERQKAADLMSEVAVDDSSERLGRMRDIRSKVNSRAEISEMLAGTNTAVQEAEFMKYAEESQANDEFASLIGIDDEPVVAAAPPVQETQATQLPEL